jgi:hypothetical protein
VVGDARDEVEDGALVLVVGGYGNWHSFAFVVGFAVECDLRKERVLVRVSLG